MHDLMLGELVFTLTSLSWALTYGVLGYLIGSYATERWSPE